jgi:hypothetical protein
MARSDRRVWTCRRRHAGGYVERSPLGDEPRLRWRNVAMRSPPRTHSRHRWRNAPRPRPRLRPPMLAPPIPGSSEQVIGRCLARRRACGAARRPPGGQAAHPATTTTRRDTRRVQRGAASKVERYGVPIRIGLSAGRRVKERAGLVRAGVMAAGCPLRTAVRCVRGLVASEDCGRSRSGADWHRGSCCKVAYCHDFEPRADLDAVFGDPSTA